MQCAKTLSSLFLYAAVACVDTESQEQSSSTDAGMVPLTPARTDCAKPNTIEDGMPCSCETDCKVGAMCWAEPDTHEPRGICGRYCHPERSQCGAGASCWSHEFERVPAVCNGSCESDRDCGPAMACWDGSCCVAGICMQSCKSSDDCPTSRQCIRSLCLPMCLRDSDCEGGHCNLYTRLCQETDPAKKGLSAACLRAEDCRSSFCDQIAQFCRTDCYPESTACPEDGVCVGLEATDGRVVHTCLRSCNVHADCPEPSQRCIEHEGRRICRPIRQFDCMRPRGSVEPAGQCACDLECKQGTCATEANSGIPHGSCSVRCSTDEICGATAKCNSAGLCSRRCSDSMPCAGGDYCGLRGECVPACRSNADCETGVCDAYSLLCRPPRPGAGLDEVCTDDTDCRSGFCIEGRCMSRCFREPNTCPESALCAGDVDDLTGICAFACTADEDCPSGRICQVFNSNAERACFAF